MPAHKSNIPTHTYIALLFSLLSQLLLLHNTNTTVVVLVAHDGGHSSIYPYYRAVIFKIATEEEILEFSS